MKDSISAWEVLPTTPRAMLILATIFELLACLLTLFFSESAFLPFQLTNKISDPIAEGGLGAF